MIGGMAGRVWLFLWMSISLTAWAADSCHVQQVKTLPGSGAFASDFLEAMVSEGGSIYGLTADLSSKVPAEDRAMYISRSNDGGKTWTQVAHIRSQYFDADIGEGERNGLAVYPGGREFVITTQLGAFQVLSQDVVRAIPGPRVPQPDPELTIPKKKGDPVTAGVVQITPDGQRLIVGYGYFDLQPQMFSYRRSRDGHWVDGRPMPSLPTEMDILSLQFGPARSLYVGTGDQAFRLKARARVWTRIEGVGPDSAIQGISMVGGPHLAACWGVYNPVSADMVERVTHASFLLHRNEDEAGPNIRAFTVEVDPGRPSHEVVTSLTGVYASGDRGVTWKRLNELPNGEFRSAHFAADGTVIVSGIEGTFVSDPYSKSCSARLQRR
jgi:hypothetical protein